jgi:ATP-dependent RNA helicase RhlE
VHRIGRTARAGASGIAISFCDGEERAYLVDIERLTRQRIPRVEEHPFRSGARGGGGGAAHGSPAQAQRQHPHPQRQPHQRPLQTSPALQQRPARQQAARQPHPAHAQPSVWPPGARPDRAAPSPPSQPSPRPGGPPPQRPAAPASPRPAGPRDDSVAKFLAEHRPRRPSRR